MKNILALSFVVVFLGCISSYASEVSSISDHDILSEITGYESVKPQRVLPHGVSAQANDPHPHLLHYNIQAYGKEFKLRLEKNTEILADGYKEIEMSPEGEIVSVKTKDEVVNCYYRGDVAGDDNSFVAVSTCNGMKGVMYAHGEHLHIVPAASNTESHSSTESSHYVFRQSEIKALQRGEKFCGLKQDEQRTQVHYNETSAAEIVPTSRRLLATCTGTVKYVEEFIVNEFSRVQRFGATTQSESLNVVNIADGYYAATIFTYCVRVVMKGQVSFSTGNPSAIRFRACNTADPTYPQCGTGCHTDSGCSVYSSSGSEVDVDLLLNDFTAWYQNNKAQLGSTFGGNVDNTHLWNNIDFAGATVGLAWVGTMCGDHSTGVEQMTTIVPGWNAQVYAHEMGHNFGMVHDGGDGAIMSPYSNPSQYYTAFSAGSVANANTYFTNTYPRYQCLDNAATAGGNPGTNICGNGVLDAGEQCDAGGAPDSCCTSTCQLAPGCQCANSMPCCANGLFKPATTICRAAVDSTCDTAEFCTGSIGFCPPDKFAPIGTACTDSGLPTPIATPPQASNCYNGKCVYSRTSQCRIPNNFQMPTWRGCATSTACNRVDCIASSTTSTCSNSWGTTAADGTPCGGGTTIASQNSRFCLAGSCNADTSFPLPSTLSVTSPAAGASWTAGSSRTITWTYTGFTDPAAGNIKIFHQLGATSTLLNTVSATAGSYTWTIPSNLASSSNYKIRLESATKIDTFGYSPSFAVTSAVVDYCGTNRGGCDSLTTCTNGATGAICSSCPAGYTGTGATGCVRIIPTARSSSSSSSSTGSNRLSPTSSSTGQPAAPAQMCTAAAPCVNSGTCLNGKCSCLLGFTGAFCEIFPTIFQVSAPMKQATSESYQILWRTTGGVPTVSIKLFAQNAMFATTTIATTAPSNAAGEFIWTLPHDLRVPSGNYYIKIQYTQYPISASSAVFAIDGCTFHPCENGGACDPVTATCTCPTGASGASCDVWSCEGVACGDGVCNQGVCDCTGTGKTGAHCEISPACNLQCLHGGLVSEDCTSCVCDFATGQFQGPTCATCGLLCLNGGTADATCNTCTCKAGFGGSMCELTKVCLQMRLGIRYSAIQSQLPLFMRNFATDIAIALKIDSNLVRVQSVVPSGADASVVTFCLDGSSPAVIGAFRSELARQMETANSTLEMGDTTFSIDTSYGIQDEVPAGPQQQGSFFTTTTIIITAVASSVALLALIGVLCYVRRRRSQSGGVKAIASISLPIRQLQPSPKVASPTAAWKEYRSDTGQVYYYNSETQESRWEKPAEVSSCEHPISPSSSYHSLLSPSNKTQIRNLPPSPQNITSPSSITRPMITPKTGTTNPPRRF